MMRTRLLWPLFALVAIAGSAHAQKRQPVAPGNEERRLVEEANEFHDHQDVDAAIARYEQVLAMNPHNVDALYELATCRYERQEFAACEQVARRGVQYESEHLGSFYVTLGACYDRMGRPQEAESTYREGLRFDSTNFLLYYNLAVTSLGLNKLNGARDAFEHALLLNPNHASSHFGLGQLYFVRGYRVPALLALSRALLLEPSSGRAESAIQMLRALLKLPPTVSGAATFKPSRHHEEGDFSGLDAAIVAAAPHAVTDGQATLPDHLRAALQLIGGNSGRTREPSFAGRYYQPYVVAAVRAGYLETMVCIVTRTLQPEERAACRDDAKAEDAYLKWTRSYHWTVR
ncbi:MAG TPA: tetratricopeptide repeat protein [Candidatus Kapabacteria bacterium]|nr:tetratricopeptide repeat protein [Candidatus Kapabacteria bacterium]